jgi:hypothetical protein
MKDKSKAKYFFATRDDLIIVLQAVEARYNLKYIECGLFDAADRPVFNSFAEIMNFGIAVNGDSNAEANYLVLRSEATLRVREVPQRKGGIKYAVDQQLNPESITIRPAGKYRDSAIIAGMVGTVHHDDRAEELLAAFFEAFKIHFINAKSYIVGPEALKSLESGFRLTQSINSPTNFDLIL